MSTAVHTLVLFLALIFSFSEGYKILVYNNLIGHSHVKFLSTLADTLTDAGHDVTVFFSVIDHTDNKTALKTTKKTIFASQNEDILPIFHNKDLKLKDYWTKEMGPVTMFNMFNEFKYGLSKQCERVLTDKQLLDRIRAEKFDIAVGEPFCECAFLFFEAIQVPTFVAALSATTFDHVSKAIGQPAAPSYVPGTTSTYSDKMTLLERLGNTFQYLVGVYFFSAVGDYQTEVIRKHIPSMRNWDEIVAESAYVFTNGHPLLDFPAPGLTKVIPIGGLNVQKGTKTKKLKLSEEWEKVLSARKSTVLVSFGSNMRSVDMPEEYKKVFLSVFETMPETTFIWKYEEEGAKIADHLQNVKLSTWVPQNELLADDRLTTFITHGGLASTMELAFLGKPAIMIPMFADQGRNALMLSRHGGAVVLDKKDLHDSKKIADTIKKVINDDSYRKNAEELAKRLEKYPLDQKKVFVDHVEFAAEFGRLPNLVPHGRHLSLIQYYLVDVIVICLILLPYSILEFAVD